MNLHHKSERANTARGWADEFEESRLSCADAPDTTKMNEAAAENAKLGKDAFEFYKAEYEKAAPDRSAASALAREQSGLQNDLSKQQLQVSQQERARYQSTFQPIEQQIAADAMGYDTPARREAEAAAATADVQREVSGQRASTMRAMERSGALPSSGRVAALQGAFDIGAAKLRVGASNKARRDVETIGAAKMADAAGLGRGVVTNQAMQAQLGITAGNSAIGAGTTPLQVAAQGAQMMGQGFQTGIAGNASAGQIYGAAGNLQTGADQANGAMMGGAGAAIGGIAMAI